MRNLPAPTRADPHRAVPHWPQNFAFGVSGLPHEAQKPGAGAAAASSEPQLLQNLPGATLLPHLPHTTPGATGASVSPPSWSLTSICARPMPTPRPAPPNRPAPAAPPSPEAPFAIPSPAPSIALPAAN